MSEPELQGWYYQNPTSEAVRVRLSLADRSVLLHTLSDRLIASWSLDRLENRRIPVLGERWSIGDPHLPEAYVVLESDRDYEAVRMVSPELRAVRARLWHQLGFSVIKSGRVPGLAVLLWLALAGAVAALWKLF